VYKRKVEILGIVLTLTKHDLPSLMREYKYLERKLIYFLLPLIWSAQQKKEKESTSLVHISHPKTSYMLHTLNTYMREE
jgi:hypothetical protein